MRASQYSDQFVDESYTLACTAPDGTVLETTTVRIARGQLVNRSICTQGGVGGSVPAGNDPVAVAFEQAIGANDPLRTGTYSKTLTFSLSTTNPEGARPHRSPAGRVPAGDRLGTDIRGEHCRDPRLR